MTTDHSVPSSGAPETGHVPAGEILVPVDFSDSSVHALHHAAELAACQHARLTLLNVVEPRASFRRLDIADEQRRRHNGHVRRLEQLARKELDPRLSARLLVCDGEPVEQIRRVAEEDHASLIVMGRHERRGLRHWFHVHTIGRVTSSAPCPVLVLGVDPVEPAGNRLAMA